MKKFFAAILIALVTVCCAGCSLLDGLVTQQTELDPNSYFIYGEVENIDDTYSTSFYLEIPESFFLEYGVSTMQVNEVLPAVFAHEMIEKPYGITLGKTALIGATATWSDQDKGVSWVCEQSSLNGAYCFQAVMTFDNVYVFLDYLSKGRVLGTKSMFRTNGVVEGEGRFDPAMIFTAKNALYNIQGVALSEPMKDVMAGWQAGFADASDTAFGTFWNGYGTHAGLRSAFGTNAQAAFDALSKSTYFCYQFASASFNGANGQYDKLTGMRSGLWGYKIDGTVTHAKLAKMYFRSPRAWLWYLIGAIVTALIGLFIYFMLRNAEQRKAAREAHRPYAAPFTSPVKPFEDYEKGADPFGQEKTPFGDEYENKD